MEVSEHLVPLLSGRGKINNNDEDGSERKKEEGEKKD